MRVQSRFPSPASALPAPAFDGASPDFAGDVPGARDGVDVALDLDPAHGLGAPHEAVASAARRRDARAGRVRRAVALGSAASALTLAGCALWPSEAPPRGYQIAPVYRIDDTPQAVEAYLAAGRYFEGSRDWARAAQSYRKAAQRDAASEAAWDGLGRALASAGRIDEAEAALRHAVALAPQHARAHNNLAYVLLLKDEPAPALAALDEALKLDPSHAMARANREEAMSRLAAARPATGVALSPLPELDTATVPTARVPESALATVTTVATIAAMGSPGDTAPPPSACERPKRLEVSNGMGATGLAARVDGWLTRRGLPRARLTNQPAYDVVRTRVDYGAGQAEAARCVARALPPDTPSELREQAGLRGDVRLVIGRDWPARGVAPAQTLAGL